MSAFRNFMNRPLHMNKTRNWVFYSLMAMMLNNGVNRFWVTDSNPEGLTGFPGSLLLAFSFLLCFTIAVKENHWVDEIRYKERNKR